MKKMRLTVLFMAVGLALTSISFFSCKQQTDDNTNKEPQKTQEEIEAEQKAKAMTDAFNAKKAVYGEKEYINYEEYRDEQNYTKIRLLNTKKLIFKNDTITPIDIKLLPLLFNIAPITATSTYSKYPKFPATGIVIFANLLALYASFLNSSFNLSKFSFAVFS